MYTTRSFHPKVASGYTTIGDPYKDVKEVLPDRWKGKGFVVPAHIPSSNVPYQSEPYMEMERYAKTQPVGTRKKGFGTGDANRRGEFTATVRTEQYRDLLKRESKLVAKFRDQEKEDEILRKAEEKYAATRTFCAGQTEIRHLYDVGRTLETEFDPKRSRDRFYKPCEIDKEKRLGGYRPMSMDIGDGSWEYKYKSPEFGPTAHTKNFYDKGHLQVAGF